MFVMYLIILNVLVVLVVAVFDTTKKEMRSKTTMWAQISQIMALRRLKKAGGITLADIKVRAPLRGTNTCRHVDMPCDVALPCFRLWWMTRAMGRQKRKDVATPAVSEETIPTTTTTIHRSVIVQR